MIYFVAIFTLLFVAFGATAAPAAESPRLSTKLATRSTFNFTQRSYVCLRRSSLVRRPGTDNDHLTPSLPQFHISNGIAGTARAQAEAVFAAPFTNVDLTTVDPATLAAVRNMSAAAAAADSTGYDPAIAQAAASTSANTGADVLVAALQNGKTKNRVLAQTGGVMALRIELVQARAVGNGTAARAIEGDLAEEQ